MPRKKRYPNNRSTEDEDNSKEIESDSPSELNSRRNTSRKKPQRKCSLKQSQNDSLKSTEKRQREKLQGNSSEKNEKRPSIIKIFRRIDRKAKNIYLVDDKVVDRNELVTPPVSKSDSNISNSEKSPHPLERTSEKRSLLNRCATQMPFRTFIDHPKRTVKTNCGEHDFEVVNMRNLPCDRDASQTSMTGIVQTAKEAEIDVWNQHCDTDDLYSAVTHIAETPGRDDVWNQPCDTDCLYSPVTDIAETPGRDDVWNQPCDTDCLYSPVTEIAETPGKADSWKQPRDIEALYPSETDIDQTLCRADVCSRLLNSYFDAPDSSVTEIEQTSSKSDAFNLLNTDLGVSSDDKISNKIISDHFNFFLNSDLDASAFLAADVLHRLNKAKYKIFRQPLSSEIDASKYLLTGSDS